MNQHDEINQALRQGARVVFSGAAVTVTGVPVESESDASTGEQQPMASGSGDGEKGQGPPMVDPIAELNAAIRRQRSR